MTELARTHAAFLMFFAFPTFSLVRPSARAADIPKKEKSAMRAP
ncbi:response regulator [Burkholderia mallei]|nr:response regulator [Burkholderia mallei]